MKYFSVFIALVFGVMLLNSCSKESVLQTVNKDSNIQTPVKDPVKQFSVNTSLIYFDIPVDLVAPLNNSTENVIIITEDVLRGEQVYNVIIEYTINEDNKIISLGISNDFAASMGYDDEGFIVANHDKFVDYRNLVFKDQRGWLGRFFIGKVVNGPCTFHRRNWYNDHWLAGTSYGGEEPC